MAVDGGPASRSGGDYLTWKFISLLILVLPASACSDYRSGAPEPAVSSTDVVESSSPVLDLSAVPADAWVELFDGRSLEGWVPKIRGQVAGSDSLETFRVQDGAITVSYERYPAFGDTFGHLFHETRWAWYHLVVEYRFFGEQLPDGPGWAFRNSGIMVHGQTPGSMGIEQDFPVSIEVQLLGGNGSDDRTTANLCTPGTNVVFGGSLDTRHCISSSSDTWHGDGWVTASVTVFGDSLVVHGVHGVEVLRYARPQIGGGSVAGHDEDLFSEGAHLGSGTISLQSESHPVQFRRVSLLNLSGCTDPQSPAYRPWFVHHDPGACAADPAPRGSVPSDAGSGTS